MRILIVDDEPLNRFLLLHMLEETGYTDCYEAESGREAIQLAQRIDPDLVLLDVVMPDISGLDVAPQLKELAGDLYLPIIFITALDDQESLARCLEAGGDDFVSKPFDKTILTAKIRAHARTRQLSRKATEQNRELTYFRNGVEREHAIVEHIFANALSLDPTVTRFIDYRLAPASSFNGDLLLAEPSPSGGLYVLMGDFTGHGLASAIGALPVARAFQAMASKGVPVGEMASTINHTLLPLLPDDMFFAAVILEINQQGNQITLWNGGMPDVLLIEPSGRVKRRFESQHMALGILSVSEFADDVSFCEAQTGDRLLGYSDGVVESVNQADRMLGEEALIGWLSRQPDLSVQALSERLESFRGEAEQQDDITLLSIPLAPIEGLRREQQSAVTPFQVSVVLNARELKSIDPIQDIVRMVVSQLGMERIRSDLSTVLSELFNNALDHGVLKLSSGLKQTTDGFFAYFEQRMQRLEELVVGQVTIDVIFNPDARELRLVVFDSGDGFDWQSLHAQSDSQTFGRGVPLIREICQSLEYSHGGRCATVIFRV
ncbi:fused response regulator/phosphatase [Aestuariibacter halophilus]|uniref:Fused response regulator/phosphatase n=1 Tax=Fluctibacter halophilus TaxID=226011 RepID=A0ABS8G513_9ALTE|nr:fused response regulator/phosphatase [Aestuariibacter halophilus]MCC2615201.1 fused response regulator/phosphatase [Aestuariibacter halophilus]